MAAKRIISLAGLLALLAVSAYANPSSRIWDGSDATTGAQPWAVSLRVDGAHKCCGTIISEQLVLTAGSCVSQLGANAISTSRVNVRVGSINQFAGGEIVSVQSINIHASYGNFLHNVAILTLAKPLTFSDKVNKVELAPADLELAEGDAVTVSGWGLQETGSSPYKLQQLTMKVLGAAECELQAGYGYESVICLEHPVGSGICRGDEGAGVLNAQKQLVGVASFAFGSCGTKYPDISSKVTYYNDWIQSINA